jgi:hypothetical protein
VEVRASVKESRRVSPLRAPGSSSLAVVEHEVELKQKLSEAVGPKRQEAIKKEIEEAEERIKGHEKTIRQKWPNGPPSK